MSRCVGIDSRFFENLIKYLHYKNNSTENMFDKWYIFTASETFDKTQFLFKTEHTNSILCMYLKRL